MDAITLALEYYKIKEKAVLQRHDIDYTRAEHLEKIKEDKSAAGKAQLAAYEEETKLAEEEFTKTIDEMQPVFEELYSLLEGLNAYEQNPCLIESDTIVAEFYIDNNKNIHYKKIN